MTDQDAGHLAAVVAAAFLVPWVRRWIVAKLEPMYRQVWPRLSEMLGQPWRIAAGFAGNIVMTMGYVLAFDAFPLNASNKIVKRDLARIASARLAAADR